MKGNPLTTCKYGSSMAHGAECREDTKPGEAFSLGEQATVFEAEVFTILQVAKRGQKWTRKENAHLLKQQNNFEGSASSALLQECREALEELASLNWIPRRRDVEGNKSPST